MKYSVDFCTARQFLGADFAASTFNAFLQVLCQRRHHPKIENKTMKACISGSLAAIRLQIAIEQLV